jgi:hypothetical protein
MATLKEITLSVDKLKSFFDSAIASLVAETAKETPKGKKGPAKAATSEAGQIQIWEDDPFLTAIAGADPVPAEPIAVDVPTNNQGLLNTKTAEERPDPEIYEVSTPEFRYWNAESALARVINFWGPILPTGTRWSSASQPLPVGLDEGVDLNAFYARDSGLNFFHDEVEGSKVFSGESPHVVCHECGHAILDAVKPELFDAMSIEVAAFHEAFGDISSMLSALQTESIRDFVLKQTAGKLGTNSRLSQLARQLGWAIRTKFGPASVDRDCLRNTCNSFFYQDPSTLPPSASASQLSSEPHSFSRVFSGAFLDVLAGMFEIGPAAGAGDDIEKLRLVSIDAGTLLIAGVRLAPVDPGFYSQVAAGMIHADETLTSGRYRTALSSSFVQRGIFSPAAAVSFTNDLKSHAAGYSEMAAVEDAGHLRIEGDNEGFRKTFGDLPALPARPLTTAFGSTFYVHMAAEPRRFAVMPAAVTGGFQKLASAEDEARSFVEDLIQLDRISHDGAKGMIPLELAAPGKAAPGDRTHYFVKKGARITLKRHHFDCGCRRMPQES